MKIVSLTINYNATLTEYYVAGKNTALTGLFWPDSGGTRDNSGDPNITYFCVIFSHGCEELEFKLDEEFEKLGLNLEEKMEEFEKDKDLECEIIKGKGSYS